MYRVLKIIDYEMTRDVVLMNTETGTIDTCFDDSVLVSEKNFGFMAVNHVYTCRISLFGSVSEYPGKNTALCIMDRKDVLVGKKMMALVSVNHDSYFIPQHCVEGVKIGEVFLYRFSRKNLIQVDNVIHADLMDESENI